MIPGQLTPRIDLLTWPILGRFLRWRHARAVMQAPLLLLAALMIFDGLVGPQLAPKNLATVGTWLHYRGLVVLALLLAGNLFCMVCPFMLPRQIGRWLRVRFLGGGRVAPRWLRTKWLALALVVLFFFCYEVFSLWATPWWTAWIAAGYFAVAFAVDTLFRGATFCKHVCPLGQFNFFGSLISPLEIKVRQPAVCGACRTKDCLTCELWLFQPRKIGNMDCTFCLDCVHACPYDNIGLIARAPTAELWADPFRSGIGRFSRRVDLAALVVLFVFGAYLNAFAMIRPVHALQGNLARWLDTTSRAPGLALIFVLGLVIIPGIVLALAGLATRAWGGPRGGTDAHAAAGASAKPPPGTAPAGENAAEHPERSAAKSKGRSGLRAWPHPSTASRVQRRDSAQDASEVIFRAVPATVLRYVYALVPMGFGMWLAHYTFHFLTGGLTIVPVAQSFLADIGLYRGEARWGMGPLIPGEWLFPIEAVMLYLGAFGAIVAAFQIARREIGAGDRAAVLAAAAPWIGLTLLLLGFGLWILVQPMEMRGTLLLATPEG